MRSQGKEQGYTLVIITALLVVFLGFTALSVDFGVLYSARASAQRAADAAALAGAFVFITRTDLNETTAPKQSDVIKANAIQTAAQNKMLGAPVTIATSDVTVDIPNRRVTVQVNQSQPTLFARILGENSANIYAKAVAEASATATADRCSKPWFLPNTVMAPEEICDSTKNGVTTVGACTLGHVFLDPITKAPTQWGLSKIGQQFIIKPKNQNQGLAPGQMFAIRLQDSSGGSDYRTNIQTCTAQAIVCGDQYDTENGVMNGPTKQGACGFVCYNGDPNCSNCEMDIFLGVGRYKRPDPPTSDGKTSSTSRSLAVAPIVDVCTLCPNLPTGQTTLTVMGFATVFIDGVQGSDVLAHLVGLTKCGDPTGINPEETGAYSLPIRLVRVP